MSIIILTLWLGVLPLFVGSLVGNGLLKWKKNLPFIWISGQILLWALFQLICVPFILLQKDFAQLVRVYGGMCGLLAVLALLLGRKYWKKPAPKGVVVPAKEEGEKWRLCLWSVFCLLLVFQLVQALRLTYSDGDDAFYVAVASVAEESGYMYMKLPYTGGATGLDARHSLAPFPIWIAFLSRISGMQVVSVAHIVVPFFSILMVYGIYYLIGNKLFGRTGEKLPFFLVLTQLLFLFGGYSAYTAEKFLLARSRQGKAALAGLILPFLFFCFLLLLDRVQERQKVEGSIWTLLVSAMMAGCMCSTQGAELCGFLTVVFGICAAVGYRRWRILVPLAFCCLPAACYAVMYVLLR